MVLIEKFVLKIRCLSTVSPQMSMNLAKHISSFSIISVIMQNNTTSICTFYLLKGIIVTWQLRRWWCSTLCCWKVIWNERQIHDEIELIFCESCKFAVNIFLHHWNRYLGTWHKHILSIFVISVIHWTQIT